MCKICVDYQLGKLTRSEASKHRAEFYYTGAIDLQHVEDIEKLLKKDEPILEELDSMHDNESYIDNYDLFDDFDEV